MILVAGDSGSPGAGVAGLLQQHGLVVGVKTRTTSDPTQ